MAFYDAPEVDDNSMRSEESVNAVRSWFTRRNGFIFRTEEPDYGVDVDVELIVSDRDASSWKFPIQIKSTANLSVITEDDNKFISLPFFVSRLGYLAKRVPTYGIVLVYDDNTKISYFDYVDINISRLDQHSMREGWRDQKQVNILVPLQELTNETIAELHRTMVNKHVNHTKLIEKHGDKFNIPYLQVKEKRVSEFDLTDPGQIVVFLKKYGLFMFNEKEYGKLVALLQSINNAIISSSLDLLFLATITYTNIGNVIEADYYMRKIEKRSDEISVDQKALVQFSQIRLSFLKGEANYSVFLEKFNELKRNVDGVENQLTVAANTLYFEITSIALEGKFNIKIKDKIDELTIKIKTSELSEEQCYLLLVYQAENIHAFALEAFLYFNSQYQLSLSLKTEISLESRINYAKLSTSMMQEASKVGVEAYNFADRNELLLLKAVSAHNLGKFFFQMKYYFLMQGIEDSISERLDIITDYRRNYSFSVIAYNHFMQLHMHQNAHEAVTNAYELQYMCLKQHLVQIGTKVGGDLMVMIKKLEVDNDLQPFNSSAAYIWEATENMKSGRPTSISNSSDSTIRTLAKQALEIYNLPKERLGNIVSELKAIQLFEMRCKNPDIELLTNNTHIVSKEMRYAYPPSFVLSHKKLNYRTPPFNDVEELFKQFNHLLSKK